MNFRDTVDEIKRRMRTGEIYFPPECATEKQMISDPAFAMQLSSDMIKRLEKMLEKPR